MDESRVEKSQALTAGAQRGRLYGYVPYSRDLDRPADRRRFPRYAAIRNLSFDVVSNWEDHEVLILSSAADITRWVHAPLDCQIVFDMPDAYLDERRGPKQSIDLIEERLADARTPSRCRGLAEDHFDLQRGVEQLVTTYELVHGSR